MQILLPTLPAFLRRSFPSVRSQLVGATVQSVLPQLPAQSTIKRNWWQKTLRSALQTVLALIFVLSLAIGVSIAAPAVYYQFFPADVVTVVPQETGTAFGGDFENGGVDTAELVDEEPYIPPVDANLPEGDWVVIPRIGVRTALQPTKDPEEALQTGVWQVPDFGEPGSRELPMILAAHRYGWQWWWKTDYWKYHSFYLLPDTQPGDRIEVISDQRKWVYEIYAGEEGEEITDYTADLILYTCKFLQSPVRHFRYARLIDPTVDTQLSTVR